MIRLSLCILLLTCVSALTAQYDDFTNIRCEVDFSKKLRSWDGFGFNYVETAQTLDYEADPQEYGGFSLLNDEQKSEIVDMIFGEEGLKVGLVKMFLDPWHQSEAGGAYDHEHSTQNMREFVRRGLKATRDRGGDLKIITTLYGPPPYMTQQKFLRGRDLDPTHKDDLANYMIDWANFLIEEEGFPLKYISLHNEGEDWWRWPVDGESGNIGEGHDYNMFWSPELVTEFITLMRKKLDEKGLTNVGVTNGEPTNWYRFATWGYADEFINDTEALFNLGIISSHGFYSGGYRNRWFGPHTSEGIDKLRAIRPELHAWVTSTSWSNMDAKNIKEMHGNIYNTKVNGIIPWAGIQRPPQWVGGDPNPGSAFTVQEDGTYEVRRGYYFYKQITRAGQPGMAVVNTFSLDSQIAIIGFGQNGTEHPDAFVIVNWSEGERPLAVEVKWSAYENFEAFRTTEGEEDQDNGERYQALGDFQLNAVDKLIYTAPAGSVTTFFGKK